MTSKNRETKPENEDAPESFPRTVRTTMQPDTDLEVTRTEYQELKVQGLLKEEKQG